MAVDAFPSGTPRLLRAINERAALELLLDRGPLPRGTISALTGLSKPTAGQLIDRLIGAGLVREAGVAPGGPGPSAVLYEIDPARAHVAGVDVTHTAITVSIADITGRVVAEHVHSTVSGSGAPTGEDPVGQVRTAVDLAAREAGLTVSDLWHTVVGLPAAVDPTTGGLGYARDLTGWHEDGLLERFRAEFGVPIDFENDANLAAVAERHGGQAAGFGDFVLLWVADGIGMAIVLGGEFWRGASGGAGEVGYMPMPGTPVIRDVSRNQNGGFQSLAGGNAVVRLAEEHGIDTAGSDAASVVAAASERADAASAAFLGELAFRVATGLAVIAAVIDPPLVVLTGATLRAGGERLRDLISRELRSLAISRPEVRLTSFEGNPVLAGAIRTALRVAREAAFARTAD